MKPRGNREKARRLFELLGEAVATPADPDAPRQNHPELIAEIAPVVDNACRTYFRMDVEGFEHVPERPCLVVMNHEAGISFLQVLGFGARWYLERGPDDLPTPLMHDQMFQIPAVGNVMSAFGCIRASHRSAEAAIDRGEKVLVAPGGNLEAFRPFSKRYEIVFGGHKGWARLARKMGADILPVVFAGGQESFFVLHDGQEIVRRFGLKRWVRLETFPIFLGLPWGLGVGPLFHIPLPAKCSVRILEPIPVEPGSDDDSEPIDRLYDQVTQEMGAALRDMGERRRFPVLG